MAEGAQGFTVLQGRIQVTVLFDGPIQKTVTVLIYPSMKKVWNVFILGRVLVSFCYALHVVVIFHAFG